MMIKNYRKILFYLLNIVVPLVLGVFVYGIFREDILIVDYLSRYIDLSFLRIDISNDGIRYFVRYYLADFLWAYSLTFAVNMVIGIEPKDLIKTFFLCLIVVLCIEGAQLSDITNGTADIFDVLVEFLAIILAIIIIIITKGEKNE